MEAIMFSKYQRLLLCVLLGVLFLLDGVKMESYVVGDENGWNSGTGTNYIVWARRHNFSVGDILVFKYSKGQHNVKEVIEATYQSCNASIGVLAIYDSGNDAVKLTEPKKYNFICDKDRHCLGCMRFWINVIEAGGSSDNTTTTAAAPPPQFVFPPGLENSFALKKGGALLYFVIAVRVLCVILI